MKNKKYKRLKKAFNMAIAIIRNDCVRPGMPNSEHEKTRMRWCDELYQEAKIKDPYK